MGVAGNVTKPFCKNKVIEVSLEKLSEEYRLTFSFVELIGISVEETADMRSTTTSNVKVRLNCAKMMLRKEIEKTYVPEDIHEFNLIYCYKIVKNVMEQINKTAKPLL